MPRTESAVAVAAREVAAPAKINLALHVTGRRADGYHLIDTLVVFTGFGDTVRIEPSAADRFVLTGPMAGEVPSGAANLVLRARDALRRAADGQMAGPVTITLDKHLPVAAGIGGGSSDAAACLEALRDAWSLDTSDPQLAEIGLELGADIPMCLKRRPLLARGIGEEITTLADFPTLHMVLVNPRVAVPTPLVFGALQKRENPPLAPLSDIAATGLPAWLAAARNDLEEPAAAYAPVIGDVLAALRKHGAFPARLSGSGATCFGLFADARAAQRAADRLSAAEPFWFVHATQSQGTDKMGGTP